MRVRLLKPETFKDEHLAEVSMAARFLFVGLWTLADREGRLEDRPRWIRAELLPYDPEVDVEGLLNELANPKAFLTRYEVDGRKCIQLTNFLKHQKPHPREASSNLPAPIQAKASQWQAKVNQGAASRSVSVSVPVSDPVRTEQPVQPPPSPSVDSQSDADGDRSKLREALQDLRRRQHAFAEKTDQQILDCAVFHAPTGPVRIDTCANVMLLRATTGKVRAQAKSRKFAKDGSDWVVAEADEAREVEAWIRAKWGNRDTTAPTTIDELREDIAALKPPLHLIQPIEAALLPRYPSADADLAARLERMRAPIETRLMATA